MEHTVNSRSVIVTGGLGFIGQHVIPYLVECGYYVHIISRRVTLQDRAVLRERFKGRVISHQIDLHDTDVSLPYIESIHATDLLHLAWDTRHGVFWSAAENLDWIVTSKLILTAFVNAGGERFVAVGTSAEYDWESIEESYSEQNSKLAPLSMFGQAKGAFRKSLITLANHHKIKVAWARIFMTFGPHEDSRRLVPTTILNLLRNEPVLASSGEQVRDLLHVDDLARGLVTLLDSNIEGDVNIASGEPRTLSDILTTLGAVIGKPELIKLGTKPKQAHEPPRIVANVSRLRDELKFTPAVSFEERLLETVNWWRENNF